MKVVVSCDAVVKRDFYMECLETILGVVGENVELYTLVHNQGAVLGPVEQRKIHSTYLSKMVKTWDQFLDKAHLMNGAANGLFIPCSVDLVVNLSRGFSGQIKTCEKTKLFTIILDDLYSKKSKKTFKDMIFGAFIKSNQRKALAKAEVLLSNDQATLDNFTNAKEIKPALSLKDYKLLPEGMFKRDYFLINSTSLSVSECQDIIKKLKGQKYKFIGMNDHLGDLVKENEELFFGDRCSGEMAPLLSGAKYIVDTEESFPAIALKALSCGRPVFSTGNSFLEYGVGFHPLPKNWLDTQLSIPDEDPKLRHGVSAKYEIVKFKHVFNNEFKKICEKIESELSGSQESNPEECC